MHFLLNEAEENHLKNQMKYIREEKKDYCCPNQIEGIVIESR